MHNQASPHNTLKLYISSNMGSQTGATKRLSLADGDCSVTIGDNMKDVSDLNEMRLAVRAMYRTGQLVMPWNMAYNAIDGFLHNRNYAFAELSGRSNSGYSHLLHQLRSGPQCCCLGPEGGFLDFWGNQDHLERMVWIQTRFSSHRCQQQFHSRQERERRSGCGQCKQLRRRWRLRKGPGMAQTISTEPPRASSVHPLLPLRQLGRAAAAIRMLCLRFNYSDCPNLPATCALPSGTRLYHRCDALMEHALQPRWSPAYPSPLK